jgi:hypothetical protein
MLKRLLQHRLPQPRGELQVGGNHRLYLFHHAQPPLYFRTMRSRQATALTAAANEE